MRTTNKFGLLYGMCLLVITSQLAQVAGNHPYLDDVECPRKPLQIGNRKCLKKCRTNDDCRGRNKECLCDDVCGKSCVKPTLRCETLKPIFNGKYEIDDFNRFGATVRYSCNDGYILSGQPTRICQGDGYWSGLPPTCETEGKCRDPPVVGHASHDGPPGQKIFVLGTQLTYSCSSGYNIDGFFKAMCVGEGRWVGPRMTCSPRRCGHPGEMLHGYREGNVFIFPNRVTYTCNEGYEMVGRAYRVCQANGQWSGTTPQCRPVRCSRLGAPANGKIHGDDYTYGAVVRFSCFRGFRLVGSQSRRCQQDSFWSGQPASCAMVDCGLPGPFYNGYLDGGSQTTFGATISFKCFGRTTFVGNYASASCMENGEWSHPLPKCYNKCKVPIVKNGTVVDAEDYMTHGSAINFTCDAGFEKANNKQPKCNNGTWSFKCRCHPAPCDDRPSQMPNGIVRFYGLKHGSRARYKCNTGYEMIGDEYLTCLHGKWKGSAPYCNPMYCQYPGEIRNGQILLVGVIGKYEYRPYVRRIGHNERIEFHCNKGYKLNGPTGATCVDGRWSPDKKPYCVLGQHPRMLYIFRGKRSAGSREIHRGIYEMKAPPDPANASSVNNSLAVNYSTGAKLNEVGPNMLGEKSTSNDGKWNINSTRQQGAESERRV